MSKYLILFIIFMPSLVFALAPIKAPKTKLNQYVKEGVIIGGEAGVRFTLIDLKRTYYKKKSIERVILSVGDDRGNPLENKVSYFHVDKSSKTIRVSLSQVERSSVNFASLEKQFAKSVFVRKAFLNFDPVDMRTILTLQLRRKAKVEVFESKRTGNENKIFIDIKGV